MRYEKVPVVATMICRYKDEGVVGSAWYGASPDWGPLAKNSATKLKKGRLNVCTVYGVWSTFVRNGFFIVCYRIRIQTREANSLSTGSVGSEPKMILVRY